MSISWDSPSTVSKVERQTPASGSQYWAELAVQLFSEFSSRSCSVPVGARSCTGWDETEQPVRKGVCGVCVLPCRAPGGRGRYVGDRSCCDDDKSRLAPRIFPVGRVLSRQRLSIVDLSRLAPFFSGIYWRLGLSAGYWCTHSKLKDPCSFRRMAAISRVFPEIEKITLTCRGLCPRYYRTIVSAGQRCIWSLPMSSRSCFVSQDCPGLAQ